MSRRTETIPPDYFDSLYAEDEDPWRFRSSDYERQKYAATLAILSQERFKNALEVGCSIGVFTQMLASRCDRLMAVDASEVALAVARRECDGLSNVDFALGRVPEEFPTQAFDLIVLSEVLYYLTAPDVERVADLCRDALIPGGQIVLCHWLGLTDYPLSGDDAADCFVQAATSWRGDHHVVRRDIYRLDRISAPMPDVHDV